MKRQFKMGNLGKIVVSQGEVRKGGDSQYFAVSN